MVEVVEPAVDIVIAVAVVAGAVTVVADVAAVPVPPKVVLAVERPAAEGVPYAFVVGPALAA